MRFKVGDWVVIARVDESYVGSPWYRDYVKMVGIESVIKGIENGTYELNIERNSMWRDSELEPSKSHIINKILSEI